MWFRICCITCLLFISCQEKQPKTIRIAAAANMQFAIKELQQKFTQNTGITCDIILGSSGKLTAQIQQGAPYHLFLSANTDYTEQLHLKKLTLKKPKIFAYGNLVLWTSKKNLKLSLDSLKQQNIKHIAIANPKTAPYGKAAKQVLEQILTTKSIQEKVIYGESVSQVNQFITAQAVDVGFTSKAIVSAFKEENKNHWIDIPQNLYTPIQQAVVLLKNTDDDMNNSQNAQLFYEYLFSKEGQQILTAYGYMPPQEAI